MKITYDKQTDIAYIQMEDGKYKISEEHPGGVVVDLSKSGKILGFEIFNASKKIPYFLKSKNKEDKIKLVTV